MSMNLLNLGILAQRKEITPEPFIFTITVNSPSTPSALTLPLVEGYTYNFIVDWGDETSSEITSWDDTDKVHAYGNGSYTVEILGECGGFKVAHAWDRLFYTSVISWGIGLDFRKLDFWGCVNLTSLPADESGRLSLVTTFDKCFRDCSSLTAIPTGLFDNTVATYFKDCFYQCFSLTSIPTGLFDNITATRFEYCFYNDSALTGLAPELWLRDPEPNGTHCFYDCDSLDNYADIPAGWK